MSGISPGSMPGGRPAREAATSVNIHDDPAFEPGRALRAGVLIFDPNGRLEAADSRALELFECADLEALEVALRGLRRSPEGFFPETADTGGRVHDFQPTVHGPALRLEIRRLDGRTGSGHSALVFDHETLADASDLLRWGAWLRALSMIQDGQGHDLRSRLSGLVLHVGLLEELSRQASADPAMRERLARSAEIMGAEVRRLQALLERLLAQTRTGDQEGEPVFDLDATLRELEAMLAPQARRRRVECAIALPGRPVQLAEGGVALRQGLLVLLLHVLGRVPDRGRFEARLTVTADGTALSLAFESRASAARLLEALAGDPGVRFPGVERLALRAAGAAIEASGGRMQLVAAPQAAGLEVRWSTAGTGI